MKTLIFAVLLIAVSSVVVVLVLNRPRLVTVQANVPTGFPDAGFSHGAFEELLQRYVHADGHVDYARWHASETDIGKLQSYLAAVALYSPDSHPQRFDERNDALAYWLYAYNAWVIYGVLDRWPLASVTDVRAPIEIATGFGFFYRQRFLFGGEAYSLYKVENLKIRGSYKDARIHFVLNCASESCPVMRPELPTGDELEGLLVEAAREFVAEPEHVLIDHAERKVVLSEIFKWYEKDFINDLRRRNLSTEHGLLGYISSVADEGTRDDIERAYGYDVSFASYDWSLNDSPVP